MFLFRNKSISTPLTALVNCLMEHPVFFMIIIIIVLTCPPIHVCHLQAISRLVSSKKKFQCYINLFRSDCWKKLHQFSGLDLLQSFATLCPLILPHQLFCNPRYIHFRTLEHLFLTSVLKEDIGKLLIDFRVKAFKKCLLRIVFYYLLFYYIYSTKI